MPIPRKKSMIRMWLSLLMQTEKVLILMGNLLEVVPMSGKLDNLKKQDTRGSCQK